MPKRKSVVPEATLSELAYAALKRAIIRGDLAEGVFLSAPEIEQRYKIGRTPFREACNRLHHERLIEVVPRRGYRVTELRFREVRELIEVRLLVEAMVAELAVVRATPEQLDQFEALGRRTVAAMGEGLEAAVQANKEFHLFLAEMTQNGELVELERGLLERAERLSYQQLKWSSDGSSVIESLHEPIIAAIRKRDAAAARKAVERDISKGQNDLFGSAALRK
jgi:DNA-binding GntR family transcriptional regulator